MVKQSSVFRPPEELFFEEYLRKALAQIGYKLGREYKDNFQIITYSIFKPGFLGFLSIGSIIIRDQFREAELWVYRSGKSWVADLMNIFSDYEKKDGENIQLEVVENF